MNNEFGLSLGDDLLDINFDFKSQSGELFDGFSETPGIDLLGEGGFSNSYSADISSVLGFIDTSSIEKLIEAIQESPGLQTGLVVLTSVIVSYLFSYLVFGEWLENKLNQLSTWVSRESEETANKIQKKVAFRLAIVSSLLGSYFVNHEKLAPLLENVPFLDQIHLFLGELKDDIVDIVDEGFRMFAAYSVHALSYDAFRSVFFFFFTIIVSRILMRGTLLRKFVRAVSLKTIDIPQVPTLPSKVISIAGGAAAGYFAYDMDWQPIMDYVMNMAIPEGVMVDSSGE